MTLTGMAYLKNEMERVTTEGVWGRMRAHILAAETSQFKIRFKPSEPSPYSRRYYSFLFTVPDTYPQDPIVMKCETVIFHPNIDRQGIYKDWREERLKSFTQVFMSLVDDFNNPQYANNPLTSHYGHFLYTIAYYDQTFDGPDGATGSAANCPGFYWLDAIVQRYMDARQATRREAIEAVAWNGLRFPEA